MLYEQNLVQVALLHHRSFAKEAASGLQCRVRVWQVRHPDPGGAGTRDSRVLDRVCRIAQAAMRGTVFALKGKASSSQL